MSDTRGSRNLLSISEFWTAMPIIPSAEDILREALGANPSADVNSLHERTFDLMIRHRDAYYERRVDEILRPLRLPMDIYNKIRGKLLEPIEVGGVHYTNPMEEVAVRVRQAFQPISGNLAELCAQRELERSNLKKDCHFVRRKPPTDFIVYHPDVRSNKSRHRIEVKNVSLRERATRGFAFDGDSLFGFFNQPEEFTESNIKALEERCLKTGGYCYIPPKTLETIRPRPNHFRPNTRFGSDMARFVSTGSFTH